MGTIEALERRIGRPFAIDHVYHRWDSAFPSDYDRWTVAQGRILFLNWTSRRADDSATSWAAIAMGEEDDLIADRAADIARLGSPVLLGFSHEPGALEGDGEARSGARADYIAAWRHIVERFAEAQVENVSWVWTLTAYEFRTGDPESWYPGDEVVDWVGVDGYANVRCPWLDVPWLSWEEIFGAATDFADRHGKAVVIAEFMAGEDPIDPQAKANWFRAGVDALVAMPSIKAVVSFNSVHTCSSIVASSDEAATAYRDIGADQAFAPMLTGVADGAAG